MTASKLIFLLILLLKIGILIVFGGLHALDLYRGVSPGWSFNNLFYWFMALPLLSFTTYIEWSMIGEKTNTKRRYLPVFIWFICAAAAVLQPFPFYFETNIALHVIAILLSVVEGLLYFNKIRWKQQWYS